MPKISHNPWFQKKNVSYPNILNLVQENHNSGKNELIKKAEVFSYRPPLGTPKVSGKKWTEVERE